MELVGVHDKLLLAGLGDVVGGGQRQLLAQHVLAGEPDAGVAGAEPAQRLGEAESAQQVMPEQPVADVVAVVEPAAGVVQPVDADVVQQAARPDQVDVVCRVPAVEQLLGHRTDDQAVGVDEVERLRGRREPFVQFPDLLVGGDGWSSADAPNGHLHS
ncbi:hypothetical protein GCM10028775_64640 [Catellatospora paridis]